MDTRTKLRKHITDNGIKLSWVANKLQLSPTHLYLVLSKQRNLSEKNRKKLNELFNTDY